MISLGILYTPYLIRINNVLWYAVGSSCICQSVYTTVEEVEYIWAELNFLRVTREIKNNT